MAVLLCRCCGALLEIKEGMPVVKCDYCGVQQTIPILDFDEKALLWERAEELRRSGEFDRAMSLYEQIAELCPDEPDVYWAKVLCRYGVEYVEEPISHKRVPTINRIQYTSIIDDADYRKAVSLAANGDQRRIYILEAQALDDLRGKILSVSLNEQPYDIFICYKESDKNGRRTEDSVLAAGLYRTLSAEGWRVFFSRITLENKAGTEFEPYIFAALNSAKLMLVVGTSPDNMNAVWVKNEWSRYLARMTENGEGTLVALYKGMLKEHLPTEFSHLHAMDMSEHGFEEELIRGIRKILVRTHEPKSEHKQEVPSDTVGMLRRAELFLEDRDFSRADELCERVLDCEPENAQAYLIKLLAENRITAADKLHECGADFTLSGNYAKAMRFGDESFKAWLESEVALAKEASARITAQRNASETEQSYQRAKQIIESPQNKADLLEAEAFLQAHKEYKDSADLYLRCKAVVKVLDDESARERSLKQAEEQAQKQRKIAGISVAAACLLTAVGVTVKIAQNAARLERFQNANSITTSQSFENSASDVDYPIYDGDTLQKTYYEAAMKLYESGKFDDAAKLFESLNGYNDSSEYALLSRYNSARYSENHGKYPEAAEKYTSLGEFSDSPECARRCRYLEAERLFNEKEYVAALKILESLDGYKDSGEKIIQAYYENGRKLLGEQKYESALNALSSAGDYADTAELIIEAQYGYAGELALAEKYSEAMLYFEKLGNYKDSADLYQQAKYGYALKLRETGYYDDAITAFRELGDYSDSAVQLTETANMKRRDVKQGDIITFGGWTQGKDGEYQPLEWIVLKREGDKALVTTKYLVDFMPYGALYWKDSSVRTWLNGTFCNGAFTESEQQAICDTTLTDSLGNETLDKVFIPSWDEVYGYLAKDALRTDYSEWGEKKMKEAVQPTLPAGQSYGSWGGDPYWLRDIGNEMRVCCLDNIGHLSKDTLYIEERIGVRPAMWIELGEL